MKEYPSIQNSSKAPREMCYVFLKYDGSNLRFEWSKKQGWYKFGTRHELIYKEHPEFGTAISLFIFKYAFQLENIFKFEKDFRGIDKFTVYCEFFGERSFAGTHDDRDLKDLILFDVCPYKKGILGPKEFLKYFGNSALDLPEYVGYHKLNDQFIEDIRSEKISVESKLAVKTRVPEGVVCKGGSGHKLWMCKIKTNRYFETLKNFKPEDWKNYWE